ncbi:MAG: bifunctional adenosylcobinamide kinase/adenosylcobinamide-phosphate guanylyltransferase [Nitrospirota bacterium]
MANKVTFITGGARSGKSAFAEKLALDIAGKRAYLATAQALDAEMVARIEHHRQRRGAAWDTYEEPLAVAELLKKLSGRYGVVLLDCLTLWLSNVMARSGEDSVVMQRGEELVAAIKAFSGSCIIVSNEVGLGIVPDNALARRFRDLAGFVNQRVAHAADEAYLLTSGIPLKIK